MERDSGWPHNGHKESTIKKLQDMKKSLQEQDDLSAALSSSCKYVFSYYFLKALRQPSQKFWPRIPTTYFRYSNLYLHFFRPCCKNIFKIVCTVSEKIEK